MEKTRTFILAVAPGNVDMQTVEVLSLAKKYDPSLERSLMGNCSA